MFCHLTAQWLCVKVFAGLEAKGVQRVEITLHVGYGTFGHVTVNFNLIFASFKCVSYVLKPILIHDFNCRKTIYRITRCTVRAIL